LRRDLLQPPQHGGQPRHIAAALGPRRLLFQRAHFGLQPAVRGCAPGAIAIVPGLLVGGQRRGPLLRRVGLDPALIGVEPPGFRGDLPETERDDDQHQQQPEAPFVAQVAVSVRGRLRVQDFDRRERWRPAPWWGR
jgi:hypothetical protein